MNQYFCVFFIQPEAKKIFIVSNKLHVVVEKEHNLVAAEILKNILMLCQYLFSNQPAKESEAFSRWHSCSGHKKFPAFPY